jgi:uncharacterized membrane protein
MNSDDIDNGRKSAETIRKLLNISLTISAVIIIVSVVIIIYTRAGLSQADIAIQLAFVGASLFATVYSLKYLRAKWW